MSRWELKDRSYWIPYSESPSSDEEVVVSSRLDLEPAREFTRLVLDALKEAKRDGVQLDLEDYINEKKKEVN